MKDLKATIRLPQAVALYIASVLGAGILIIPGISAEIAGPAAIIAWGTMAILVIPMALTMAFLSQKYPDKGGVSHFVTLAFGERIGAIVGWFFLMSVPIGAPVVALSGSGYVSSAFGLNKNWNIILAIIILVIALIINYIGMHIAGKIEVIVIVTIIGVLVLSIIGAVPNVDLNNFTPFMPNGISSIGKASTILLWCFIGWEAVSHLSSEFVNPKRDTILATIIAAIIVGGLYFGIAFVTIGTKSYGSNIEASLVKIIVDVIRVKGGAVIGLTSYIICLATAISYIGAASRVAYSLSEKKFAPKIMGQLSSKYKTPIGGLGFLAVCFMVIIGIYSFELISLSKLIEIPNATFTFTYLAGCAAGIALFRKEKYKFIVSLISLIITSVGTLFIGWPLLYPLLIILVFRIVNRKRI
ncbi:APC family permease [Clostridium sp. LP20]|uniref:APC family permease n=1 Tax=Clostridium sp. LP20 TaxID=3418665 RepID=UPI003EE6DCEC